MNDTSDEADSEVVWELISIKFQERDREGGEEGGGRGGKSFYYWQMWSCLVFYAIFSIKMKTRRKKKEEDGKEEKEKEDEEQEEGQTHGKIRLSF